MDQHELKGKEPWTSEEDDKLRSYVREHGARGWKTVAQELDVGRSGNSCRLRWFNYLSPFVRRGNITDEEMLLILELHSEMGNKWSKIAQKLPGRTDNEIKNFWNTRVKKEAKLLSLDVNSSEFRKRMMKTLVGRIHIANFPGEGGSGGNSLAGPAVDFPNIDGSMWSDSDGYRSYNLVAQLPDSPAVAGGSGPSTVGHPDIDGFWSAQQLRNHGSMWGVPNEYRADFPMQFIDPPAIGGSGGNYSTGPIVGLPNIDGFWPPEQLGNHGSMRSAPDGYHAYFRPPVVAGGSGGNSSACPTFDHSNIFDGSWSAQQLGNHDSMWSDSDGYHAYNFLAQLPDPPAVLVDGGGDSSTFPTVGHLNIDGAGPDQQLVNHGSFWSAPGEDLAYLFAPLPPPTVAGGSACTTSALVNTFPTITTDWSTSYW